MKKLRSGLNEIASVLTIIGFGITFGTVTVAWILSVFSGDYVVVFLYENLVLFATVGIVGLLLQFAIWAVPYLVPYQRDKRRFMELHDRIRQFRDDCDSPKAITVRQDGAAIINPSFVAEYGSLAIVISMLKIAMPDPPTNVEGVSNIATHFAILTALSEVGDLKTARSTFSLNNEPVGLNPKV